MNVAPGRQKLRQYCLALHLRQWRRLQAHYHTSSRVLQQLHQQQHLPANTTEAEIQSARVYCTNLVRKYDTPSHILQAFLPQPARDASLALRSLNIELASIADATSNPAVAALRMQFWRDSTAAAVALRPPKEPIALLLSSAAAALAALDPSRPARLSKPFLHRLITTREQHLAPSPPFPTLAALESYAEHTYSTLLYLTLQAVPLASLTADHLASHIGKAQGIVAVLRGVPLLAFPAAPGPSRSPSPSAFPAAPSPRATVTLPLDLLAAHAVREEAVLRHRGTAPGLRDAVFAVATRAHDHLATAREMLADVRAGRAVAHAYEHEHEHEHEREHEHEHEHEHEREHEHEHEHANAHRYGYSGAASDPQSDVNAALPVLLHAVPVQLWLEQLQHVDFDVFSPTLRGVGRSWRVPWRAYWAYRRGEF